MAADLLESGMHVRGVMLRSPLRMTLKPSEEITLSGKVTGIDNADSASFKIFPRAADQLPPGLDIVNICLAVPDVTLTVRNRSRQPVRLDHRTVFAELHSSTDQDSDLEALVGPSLESDVFVEGVSARCLIDSGSQVSIMSETFYNNNFSYVPMEELTCLRVVGAGGSAVPYLGFVRVNVRLPEDVTGVNESVDVLMLVCRDTDYSQKVPIIIGTNTLRHLAELCKRIVGPYFASTMPVCPTVAFMYNDLSAENDGKVGSAKVRVSQISVPAGETVEVKCCARVNIPSTRDSVLIQEPIGTSLPEGLKVVGCRAASDCLANVKVVVVNESDHVIQLRKNQVVADIFVYSHEYDVNRVVTNLAPNPSDQKSTVFTGCMQHEESSQLKDSVHFNFGEAETIDPRWCRRFESRLQSLKGAFVSGEFDIGRSTTGDPFDIELLPGPDIRERPRPIPPKDFEDCRQHMKGLLDAKLIRPSNSPFASPIVLVRKKNGALRMCIDYRKLNARTVKDSYSIPKIEDLLLTLNGAKYFTTLDLCKAYYQVPMTERASKYSAFITPWGLFEWDRLSQGLANAPACFQRLMETVFSDMNLTELIVFLDDILIHAKSLEELEERTIRVLERLCKYNLKLDPKKCVFGATEVKHLGYVISEGSIKPDPEKVSTVKDWPKPQTVRDVKRFIGFAGFYRRFIPCFSGLARPLNDLTVGYAPGSRSGKRSNKQLTLSSPIISLWGDAQEKSFQSLISALTGDLVLGIADRSKPFTLHCDASGIGLGAVLYQEFKGKNKVISYASRGLNKSEQNYPAHKREFLALKWAMCDKFRDYLLGTKVTVVTDNNPLCYILKNAKLDATSHRWLSALSIFDFDLRYKKGLTHVDADSLSRLPQVDPYVDEEYRKSLDQVAFLVEKAKAFDQVQSEESYTVVAQDTVQAILCSHCVQVSKNTDSGTNSSVSHDKIDETRKDIFPAVEQLMTDPSLISDSVLDPKVEFKGIDCVTDWRKVQLSDRHLAYVIRCIERGKELVAVELNSPELKVYAREQKKLILEKGVLYRKVEVDGHVIYQQLVLPLPYRKAALSGVHEDLFHTHFDNAISQLRMRFFWPHMARDLEEKIKGCSRCIRKGAKCQKAPMESIVTTYPLELLSIDFLSIDVNGQKQNVLVMMDHFTKFGQAVCTRDQTAKTVARTLWKEFFMIYGFPRRILSDQGRDFESELVKELCQVAGTKKCRTTPYHPSGNPVERWNRTLLGMLRSLEDDRKVDLKKVLPEVVHAYNCCIHQSTGHSPYFLFFGRHPRLPIDLAFGIDLNSERSGSTSQYIRDLKKRLAFAYQKASENLAKTSQKNKVSYDVSARAAELDVGDRVLVRKLGPRLNSKICDRWEDAVHVVITTHDGLPVYTVQDEAHTGPKRTLHRNYLLPIGMIDSDKVKSKVVKDELTETRRKPPRLKRNRNSNSQFSEEYSFGEEFILEISPAILPNSALRVEAEEFIPKEMGVQKEIISEGGEACVKQVPGGLSDSDSASQSNGGDESASSVDSDSSEDTGSEVAAPVPIPRRSLRTRRPVERLNLMHSVCTPEVHLQTVLVDQVQDHLQLLLRSSLTPERVKAIEQVLNILVIL